MSGKGYDFRSVETGQRLKLDAGLPVVIRFDGKLVTRDHKKYRLTDMEFTKCIFLAAAKRFKDLKCTIYAQLDEVNIIISGTEEFFGEYEDTDAMYCCCIELQRFLRTVKEQYPDTMFGCSVFNIPAGSGAEYVKDRQKMLYKTSVVYCAKDCMSPALYHGKDTKEILAAIEETGNGSLLKNRFFFSGLVRTYN